MARLYSNENFPYPVVEELRRLNHDILTVMETGRTGDPDPDVLAFATSEGRATLTLNRRDFIKLQQLNSNHAGIIVCTIDPDFIGQAARIDQLIQSYSSLVGQLIRVNRESKNVS